MLQKELLKKAFLDQNNSYEDRMAAFAKLQIPGTQVHQGGVRRCSITGRPCGLQEVWVKQNKTSGSCYAW